MLDIINHSLRHYYKMQSHEKYIELGGDGITVIETGIELLKEYKHEIKLGVHKDYGDHYYDTKIQFIQFIAMYFDEQLKIMNNYK